MQTKFCLKPGSRWCGEKKEQEPTIISGWTYRKKHKYKTAFKEMGLVAVASDGRMLLG